MFKEDRQDFRFDWSHLGDIKLGRPNLGPTTLVAVYRLMQFTLRDACIAFTDPESTEKIFYSAGFNSGRAIYENLMSDVKDLTDLFSQLGEIIKEFNIGIMRLEKTDFEKNDFTLTISEDLDCSGLPVNDEAVCTYDEGLIAGILESFTGQEFEVREVDCWCTGDRTCRFRAFPRSTNTQMV